MTNLKDYLNDLVIETRKVSEQTFNGTFTEQEGEDMYKEIVDDCMDGVKKLMGIE